MADQTCHLLPLGWGDKVCIRMRLYFLGTPHVEVVEVCKDASILWCFSCFLKFYKKEIIKHLKGFFFVCED